MSRTVFWLLAAGSAAVIAFAPGGALPKCILAGCVLGAWLVRTPASAGNPAVTGRLARSRVAPVIVTAAGGWFLFLSGAGASAKAAAAAVLLPAMIVLALLGRSR